MRKAFLSLLVAVFALSLVLAGCGGSEKKDDKASGSQGCACGTAMSAKDGASCTCADVKAKKSGWCDHCGVGMVDGQQTTCSACAKSGKMCDACAQNGGKPCADCASKVAGAK
jgi:hypothetical protein